MTGLSSKRFSYTGEKKDKKGKYQKDVDFECTLKSQQCRGLTRKDKQCPRSTVMGTNLCWQHLISVESVRIKNRQGSKEKGVFAVLPDSKKWLKSGKPARIVFEKNEKIIQFKGEVLTADQVKKRYKNHHSPYVWNNEKGGFIDASCDRSAGSFIRSSDDSNVTYKEIKGKIWFIASENIKEGEEILADYKLLYELMPGSKKWNASNDEKGYRFKYKTSTLRRKKKDRKVNKKTEKVKKKQRLSGKFKNVTVRKNNKRTARQQRILDKKKKEKRAKTNNMADSGDTTETDTEPQDPLTFTV